MTYDGDSFNLLETCCEFFSSSKLRHYYPKRS